MFSVVVPEIERIVAKPASPISVRCCWFWLGSVAGTSFLPTFISNTVECLPRPVVGYWVLLLPAMWWVLGSPSGKDWRGPAFMDLTVWCEASHRLLFPTMLDSFPVGDRPVPNNVLIWGLLTWSGYIGKWNAFVWAFQHDVASLSLFLTVFFIVNSCSLSLHAKLLCKPLSVRVVQCKPQRDQTGWVSGHLMSGGWAVI